MSVDARLLVSNAQSLSSTGAVATDSIPLEVIGLELAAGEPLGFAVHVNVAADFTSANETYQVNIVSATNADGTTGQVVLSEAIVPASALTLGAKFFFGIPVGRIPATATHITLAYVLGGTTPTVTLTSYLTPQQSFDDGSNVIRSGFSVAA
jgi:hypothetical protein